jgi:hypothetical protein
MQLPLKKGGEFRMLVKRAGKKSEKTKKERMISMCDLLRLCLTRHTRVSFATNTRMGRTVRGMIKNDMI